MEREANQICVARAPSLPSLDPGAPHTHNAAIGSLGAPATQLEQEGAKASTPPGESKIDGVGR